MRPDVFRRGHKTQDSDFVQTSSNRFIIRPVNVLSHNSIHIQSHCLHGKVIYMRTHLKAWEGHPQDGKSE